MTHARLLIALLGAVPLVSACDEADDSGDGPAADQCETEMRSDDYKKGMELDGEADALSVTLLEAMPAPPAQGDNTWVVSVVDAGGAPLGDLAFEDPDTDDLITLDPQMPDHGHGTPVEPQIYPGDNAGEYVLDEINLFMAGYWEVTMDVLDAEAAAVDSVVFKFCIEE